MGLTIVWGFGVILGVILLCIYFLFYRKSERLPFMSLLLFAIIWPVTVIIILSLWTLNGLSRIYRVEAYRKKHHKKK